MKIGYLILCHKNPVLVNRIVHKVTDQTDNEAFIHVDKKCDIDEFRAVIDETSQIHFVNKREDIWWGGFNSVVATINCMKEAIAADCRRIVILQGQDYPVQSNEYIDEFFSKNIDVEFIKGFNITDAHNKKDYMKCWGIHVFDGVDRSKISLASIIAKGLELINKAGIKYHRGYYKDEKGKINIYWGWAHFALTKECTQYIVDFYESKTSFNKYFKTVFPPDETYFHTIIFNSEYKYKTSTHGEMKEPDVFWGEDFCNVTYFEYLVGKVKVLTDISGLEEIKKKGFLYLRKVDDTSKNLMDYIDRLGDCR
jgi:hypothetical protein